MPRIDYQSYIGKKMGRLTIVDFHKNEKDLKIIFDCECECGNTFNTRATNIIYGFVKSCGCLKTEKVKEHTKEMGLKNRKHEEKCDYCGKEEHYALGYCKVCYNRLKRTNKIERTNNRGRKTINDKV